MAEALPNASLWVKAWLTQRPQFHRGEYEPNNSVLRDSKMRLVVDRVPKPTRGICAERVRHMCMRLFGWLGESN